MTHLKALSVVAVRLCGASGENAASARPLYLACAIIRPIIRCETFNLNTLLSLCEFNQTVAFVAEPISNRIESKPASRTSKKMSAAKLPAINGQPKQNGHTSPNRDFDGVFNAATKSDGVILGKERRSILPANKARQHEAMQQNKKVEPASPPPKVPQPPPQRRLTPASAPPSSAGGDELVGLKRKLRDQETRLSSPVNSTPQRNTGTVALATPTSVRGTHYTTRPYSGVPARITWEPFSTDPEVIELTEKAQRSEERIRRLANEMEHSWSARRPDASIAPPDPPVFSVSDAEVMPLAAAAESFAETGHLRFYLKDVTDAVESASCDEDSVASPKSAVDPMNSSVTADGLLKRRTSSVKVDSRTITLLNSLKMPSIDLVLPSPHEINFNRQGDVLGRRTILKRDLWEGLFTRRDMIGVMSGAPYFRMIPKFNIGGVAQANLFGIQTVVNEIYKVYTGPLLWINLREEAMAYINGRSYIIRQEANPSEPIRNPGITADRITAMEEKLKREILAEAAQHGGNVCVHKENTTGKMGLLWEAVNRPDSVHTMAEAVQSLVLDEGCSVEFHRLPVPFEGMMVSQYDEIVRLCQKMPTIPIMFNCQTGRGKTTVAMVTAAIVRFYQHCDPNSVSTDLSMLRGDGQSTNFRSLLKLVTLLPNGVQHERRVAIVCELAGNLSNLKDRIAAAFKSEASAKATALLRQYAYLVSFSCYCEAIFWGSGNNGHAVLLLPSPSDKSPSYFAIRRETCACSQLFNSPLSEGLFYMKALIEGLGEGEAAHQEAIASLPPAAEGEERSFAKEIRNRHGSVLTSGMILRSYPTELAATSTIPGVVALRQLAPDVPLFTAGRSTETGMEDFMYNIRTNFPHVRDIQWVNVRAEPSVYINGNPYIMLDEAAYSEEELASLHISGERIEEIENRLKQDVIQEASENKGYLVVHNLTATSGTVAERVFVKRVQTPRGAKESATSDVNFVYHRLPVPATDKIHLGDFSPLISLFAEMNVETSAVVLTDSGGGMRTTLCLNILTLLRLSMLKPLRAIRSVDDIRQTLALGNDGASLQSATSGFYGGAEDEAEISIRKDDSIDLHAASQMSQMMTAGNLMKCLQAVIKAAGRGARWNILEALDIHKTRSTRETGEAKRLCLFRAMCSGRAYLYLLICAIYISDSTPRFAETLDQWLEAHPEVGNFLEKYSKHEGDLLKYVIHKALPAEHSIENRQGDVLAMNFGIKADHFPGCQRKGMVPAITGAPNFRKVKHLNIYGVAIPTLRGVFNVLHVLGATNKPFFQYDQDPVEENLHEVFPHNRLYAREEPHQCRPEQGRVLWVNLREEPILYVADRPFVFRDLTNPYVNVELTGIETSKIENVEITLRDDILKEAENYNGQFMVHDEGRPGQLIGVWETVTEENVQTVQHIYSKAREEGDRVTFVRLPVTDEQSPELKDFDKLTECLLPEIISNMYHEDHPLSMVFNCQMGRGRTTTGMVIAGMLVGLVFPDYYQKLEEEHQDLWPEDASESARGNYKCIMQLKSVLRDGRAAKHRVDLVLEACNRMQNLRAAIELFKDAVESAEVNEEARARALHHGINYLQRYFNLITFSSYLHEVYDPKAKRLTMTFVDWRSERDELRHIHNAAELK